MDSFDEAMFEDAEKEEDRVSSKEQLVFLIDASPAMLQPCTHRAVLEDEEAGLGPGATWLELAVRIAAEVCRQKVVLAERDEVAVIFYNTREKANSSGVDNVAVMQDLEEPAVKGINALMDLTASAFEARYGSAQGAELPGLKSALVLAAALFRLKGSKSKALTTRRVMVFTANPRPFTGRQAIQAAESAIQSLRQQSAALMLFPMVPDMRSFDLEPFWQRALAESRNDGQVDLEETEQLEDFTSLRTVVRRKGHKKRPLGTYNWHIGEGVAIGVRLFALVQQAKRPVTYNVELTSLQLVKPRSSLVDDTTGEMVLPRPPAKTEDEGMEDGRGEGEGEAEGPGQAAAKVARTFYPKDPHCRLPKAYVTEKDKLAVRRVNDKGLYLLGFKPLGTLRDHHQIRSAKFVYPDERNVIGSTPAFVALHSAMLERDSYALCGFWRLPYSEPALVALVPQQETLDEHDKQVDPPGMHMIFLPYADDIREPEADRNFTGDERPVPSEEQVAAAEALMDRMNLQDVMGWESGATPNPHLQRYYEVLQAYVEGVEPPELGDVIDYTLPPPWELEDLAAVQRFKDAVYGPGWNLDVVPPEKKGTKRAAAGAPIDDKELAAEVEALDFAGLRSKGKLGSLKNDQLKLYLQLYSLPVSGAKAALVARIENHMDMQPAPAAVKKGV